MASLEASLALGPDRRDEILGRWATELTNSLDGVSYQLDNNGPRYDLRMLRPEKKAKVVKELLKVKYPEVCTGIQVLGCVHGPCSDRKSLKGGIKILTLRLLLPLTSCQITVLG